MTETKDNDYVERPCDIQFWLKNGCSINYKARIEAETKLSLGLTNSARGLGFVVSRNGQHMDFVLDQDQVMELTAYLKFLYPRLLEPLGPEPKERSLCVSDLVAGCDTKQKRRAKTNVNVKHIRRLV